MKKFTQISLQMALTIGLGVWVGLNFDTYFNSRPFAVACLSLLSVCLSLYRVYIQVKNYENQDKT